MKNPLQTIFSTAYLGPIDYYASMVFLPQILFEREEHYIKQTYRNRCQIYTAKGLFSLSIPVNKVNGNRTKIKDIEISYMENWQKIHWRAIVSAYNQSPFFLYYRDNLEIFFNKKYKYLIDFNTQLTQVIFEAIGINPEIIFADKYIESGDPMYFDFRTKFSPKKENAEHLFAEYIQVFNENCGFIPNLSIVDLLFNEGPNALTYLEGLNITNKMGIIK